MTEHIGDQEQPEGAAPAAEAAETAGDSEGLASGAGAAAGSAEGGAGAEDADAKPTIDDFAERSGPDRRTEQDKLPPVPAADGGATAPHPGGSPV